MRRTSSCTSTTTRPIGRRGARSRSSRSFQARGCVLFSRRVLSLALCTLLAACELEKVGIPRTESRVSMHSVLSASAPTQVVLLERTRNGSVSIIAPPFDLADPVVTDEGIAESGATVSLTTPGGQTLVAREDKEVRGDGKGGGIYRF